jgi:uncharacterized protein (TIGR02284 family)
MAVEQDGVTTLNELIAACRDREEGYRTAAEGVRAPELKELFHAYKRQSAGFVAELQREVRRLGGEPVDHGSLSGRALRGWLNLKAMVTGGDAATIIAECEAGEGAASEAYERALAQPLPPEVRALVEQQSAAVREGLNRLRELDLAAAGPAE